LCIRSQAVREAEGSVTSDNLKARQELYNGFGDTLARGIELVGTPTLFGLLGYVLDRLLGTVPVMTVILVVFALTGIAVRMYYNYSAAMRAHEEKLPGHRRG
jgi:F0F1-type ATP synthase assembly protein I